MTIDRLQSLIKSGIFARTGLPILVCAAGIVCVGLLWAQAPASGVRQASAAQSSAANPSAQAPNAAPAGQADANTSDDDGPSPGDFLGSTYVPSILDKTPQAAATALVPPPTPVAANAGGDEVRQEINNETANLLAMAYALKAEVDKTNKDTLSITVVRKANQIEQLARKMRDDMRPAAVSSN